MPFAARTPRSSAPRHFVWLLWLALLLPVGQLAAMCHALSHTGQITSRQVERDTGLPDAPCDLCIIAGSLSGGGLRGEPPPSPHLAARHQAPPAAADGAWLPSFPQPYLSRAPPFSVPH